MKSPAFKIFALSLLASAACFSACGKKSDGTTGATANSDSGSLPAAPAEAMQYIAHKLAEADGAVLWQAMPGSYQSDVNSIAQLAGSKVDAEIYDKVFATVGRLVTVLDKQQEFVFGSSLLGGQADAEGVAQMRAAWPSVKRIVDALTSSSLASAAGLLAFDGQNFFSETVSDMLGEMDTLAQLQPDGPQSFLADLSQVTFRQVEGTGNQATLEMSAPGQDAETETFVKVEDRWVPQDMAEQWTDQIAEARRTLEEIDPAEIAQQKPQILGVFAMIDGVLAQIEGAETQQQFDQALQGAMMPIMGLMMMGSSMGGGSAAPEMPVTPALPDAPVAP